MDETQTKSCPKCGKRNEHDAIECQRCGIIFEKYLAIQARGKEKTSKTSNAKQSSPQKTDISLWKTIKSIIFLSVIIFAAWSILFRSNPAKNNSTIASENTKPAKRELTEAEKEQQRIESERKKAEEYELCKKNLQCWAEKHDGNAYLKSREIIEKHAKYQFEWTDGFLDSKITHYRWHNQNRLTITYLGDKIKFQNGFSAWQNMIYQIDYDPLNEKLLNVSVRPGRL